ncbi:hypothetical protein SAMN04487821_13427 [Enterococcus malodoratus]|uniref:hypothetical protein n=1 Tax=Enterococcus malodoratus TaxID=71451 RepID=UPI0008D17F04|nr:hypothetical protein [Enterococcus malodoratus]SET95933.1 hypothetical protein SAMN04487821_13427 [Enterococcus malodoratus]
MKRETELEAIKNYPDHYFEVQGRTLESRLSDVEIGSEQEIETIKTSSKEAGREAGREMINSIPVVSLVSKAAFVFMDWNKKLDANLEDVKKQMLLEAYFNKSDNHEKAIENLKEAMTDVYGNALINKIFRMLSDYPPDGDWFTHLRTALEKICESKNFEKLFDTHKFNLGLIEKMSPQALSIIVDANNWPEFQFSFSGMSIGGKVTDQFQFPFATTYAQKKGIKEAIKVERIVHIVNDLQNGGFIECNERQGQYFKLRLTNMGKSLFEYLTDAKYY